MAEQSQGSQPNAFQAVMEAVRGLAILGRSKLLRQPRPMRKGNLRLKGLSAKVEIIRDHWDIPHIYAKNQEDVFFAQGFIHAQERLWQMDFNRRLVAGRLSEILGDVSIPLDRWMRVIGMRRIAEKGLLNPDKETQSMINSYCAGVNAFIASGNLPVEFSLLNYQPEAWSMIDLIAWVKMMAWDLCGNWDTEILRAHLIDRLGLEEAAKLEPPYLQDWPRVIPSSVSYARIGDEALQRAAEARKFTGPASQEGLGSNNWVLSGTRTTTGKPILANDMHLLMSIPAIWYENHLVGGDLNVTGVSFPGIPGVISGHNQRVAWGYTNGFSDVQDLHIEHLRRLEDGSVQYEYQGEWLEAEVIQEEIRVKNGASEFEDVIITRHGPILNSLAPDLTSEQPLALRWTALEVDNIFVCLLGMNRAGSCNEFREALRNWSVPSQNTVYADVDGNIGYSLPGKLPMRAKGDGRVPVPGWTGEYEWLGYVSFEELPHQYNPPKGYVASANNRIAGDDYPYWIGYDHCTGNRAERIVELIEARDKLGLENIRQMHKDQVSPAARRIAAHLSNLQSDDPELADILEQMRTWDGHLGVDSPQAALYEVFVRRIIPRLLSGKLGDLTIRYAGKGCTPVLREGSMMGEHSREWLETILGDPTSPWFDLGDGLLRDDHLRIVLHESVDFLKEECGARMEDWKWGDLHHITFNHALGSVKPLDRFFNRGPFPMGGDGETIWACTATTFDLSDKSVVGPPFRFIADLSDWNKSLGMLVPGQSGHPSSRSYDGSIQDWMNGEYHPILFDRDAVLGTADAVLTLEPV
jgi:penicillin G amidase